jgi:glycosyltransferase involved in cell wall biosynthesis
LQQKGKTSKGRLKVDPMGLEISVIIPSYNPRPEFVAECFRSICMQEGADYEIIFVDGGSSPQTLVAAEVYRSRCTHFISERDEGQADAINKGLRLARGHLVTWLNTDDFYLPDAFMHMVAAYRRNPYAPFYMGAGYRTDSTGTHRNHFYPAHFEFRHHAFSMGLNFILQPSTFIRSETLEKAGGVLNKNLHYAFDTELWFRLLAHGNPCQVLKPVACSREYETTKTSTGAWARFNEIQSVAEQFAGCRLTPGVLAELARLLHESLLDPRIKILFPPESDSKAIALWECAAVGLRDLCGRDDGFPVKS